MKACTTFSMVSSDQFSSGSFKPNRSRHLATVDGALPYPENWPCKVSTAFASISTLVDPRSDQLTNLLIDMCLRLIEPLRILVADFAYVSELRTISP